MRKSRASHVKCDCGEKTHKCVHLSKTVEGHKDSCCCNHGGRCTCSHKKEPLILDTVPESDSDRDAAAQLKGSKPGSRSRRRANTTSGDLLSFDAQGHHKPTYKHARVSQKCGPYQLHRGNSLHGTSSTGNRSVDNLMHAASANDAQSGGSPASTSSGDVVLPSQRRVRSEAASPQMTGSSSSFSQLNGQLPPLDLSGISYRPYVTNSADFFNISDDPPMFSAGLSAQSVDWSHYDIPDFGNKTGDFAPSSYSHPPSYNGYEFTGSEQVPTLTTNTSTSGEASEAEDILSNPLDDYEAQFRSDVNGGFTLGQSGLLGSGDFSGLDYDDFGLGKTGNKFLPTPASLAGDDPTLLANSAPGFSTFSLDDDPTYWMSNYESALPVFTESPTEASVAPFWGEQ
ncbi:hypothetical protein OQA88_10039 [Cercophora sp. LCS_1]